MKKIKKLYADIFKTEDQEDGTIKVWGYASTDAKDSDGEVITADAMKAALPDYMKFGAVREMHQNTAAGTAIEASVDEEGKTFFGAHIVDPVAVKKVQTQVYKGFSIGGRVRARDELNKSIITDLELVEVSLVDRPSNPGAVITIYKAEGIDFEDFDPDPAAPAPDDQGGDPAEKVDDSQGQGDTIKKGMYSVSRFAELLESLGYLVGNAENESQYEGDNSPLPAALRDWLTTGIGLFREMAAEETAELIAALQAMAPAPATPEVVSMADGGGDLAKVAGCEVEKKGAKFSNATREKLASIHKAAKECVDHLDKLAYDDDGADKVDGSGGDSDTIEKVQREAQAAKDALERVQTERDDLQKQLDELKQQPAPAKGARLSVSKDADSQPVQVQVFVDAQGVELTGEALAKAQLANMFKR